MSLLAVFQAAIDGEEDAMKVLRMEGAIKNTVVRIRRVHCYTYLAVLLLLRRLDWCFWPASVPSTSAVCLSIKIQFLHLHNTSIIPI
jgi:hypothetical protein